MVPRFVAAIAEGRAPLIYGDGEQTRDFTYVADVVDAFVRASETAAAAGEVLNVAGRTQTSIRELAELIAEASGSDLKAEHAETRDGEVRLSQGDGSRAGELLGWSPQWLLADGVRECVRQRDLVDALA